MIKETLLESFYLDREQSELAKRSEYEKRSVTKLTEMVMKKSLENLSTKFMIKN